MNEYHDHELQSGDLLVASVRQKNKNSFQYEYVFLIGNYYDSAKQEYFLLCLRTNDEGNLQFRRINCGKDFGVSRQKSYNSNAWVGFELLR